jgi:hypothetical protein
MHFTKNTKLNVEWQGTRCRIDTPNIETKKVNLFLFAGASWESYTLGEELNMSLIRNQNPDNRNMSATTQPPQQSAEKSYIPQEELKRLHTQMMSLKAQTRDQAEDKFQVALLLATLEQMNVALTTFMTDTKNELRLMNVKQMTLLKLQDEYEATVRGEALKIVNNTYKSIEHNQAQFFDRTLGKFTHNADKLMERVDKASAKCSQSAERAEESAERMTSLKEWQDLLQWASPFAIVLYGLIQLLMWIL